MDVLPILSVGLYWVIVVLVGRVAGGFGQASGNLAPVAALVCRRMGLPGCHPGTLNVRLDVPYFVDSEAEITAAEYHGWERLLLRRCCIRGLRGVIVRPETHHTGNGHGPACLEILAEVHLRTALALADDDTVEVTTGGALSCWIATLHDQAACGS
jgi:CTP-dependent riboflavin kinase